MTEKGAQCIVGNAVSSLKTVTLRHGVNQEQVKTEQLSPRLSIFDLICRSLLITDNFQNLQPVYTLKLRTGGFKIKFERFFMYLRLLN